MKKTKIWIIFGMASVLMINGAFYVVLADHGNPNKGMWYQKFLSDREGGKKRERHRKKYRNSDNHYGKQYLTPAQNPIHIKECGGCHLAYQPDLLPAGSWDRILAGLEDHFGETVDLDPESGKNILEYLKTNSAEHSKTEQAVKIMRSLGNSTPIRITEVPYIQAKHRRIGQDVLTRESIGSLSNCSACHVTAEKGIYEDDYVRIPQ